MLYNALWIIFKGAVRLTFRCVITTHYLNFHDFYNFSVEVMTVIEFKCIKIEFIQFNYISTTINLSSKVCNALLGIECS